MKRELNYEVQKTIKQPFDSNKKYLVIKVHNTLLGIPEWKKRYILDCDKNYLQRVENWIDENVVPYMTEKSINYKTCNADNISTRIEHCLGENIPFELVAMILASKDIVGENNQISYLYPANLYYPLSDEFEKATSKGVM